MTALDLTRRPPRSPHFRIGGIDMLARTIDRARASLPGGELGSYEPIGAGISSLLLGALGIAVADFVRCVEAAENDDDVVAWVYSHADPSTFDAINACLSRQRRREDFSNAIFAVPSE